MWAPSTTECVGSGAALRRRGCLKQNERYLALMNEVGLCWEERFLWMKSRSVALPSAKCKSPPTKPWLHQNGKCLERFRLFWANRLCDLLLFRRRQWTHSGWCKVARRWKEKNNSQSFEKVFSRMTRHAIWQSWLNLVKKWFVKFLNI